MHKISGRHATGRRTNGRAVTTTHQSTARWFPGAYPGRGRRPGTLPRCHVIIDGGAGASFTPRLRHSTSFESNHRWLFHWQRERRTDLCPAPAGPDPVASAKRWETKLCQAVRDEAHRFAAELSPHAAEQEVFRPGERYSKLQMQLFTQLCSALDAASNPDEKSAAAGQIFSHWRQEPMRSCFCTFYQAGKPGKSSRSGNSANGSRRKPGFIRAG